MGLAFPVPGMMERHWTPDPMPEEFAGIRRGYKRALEAAQQAQMKVNPSGKRYVDYWIGRLESGAGYIDTVESVRRAAIAEAAGDFAEALGHAETALAAARRALESCVRVAGDRSDLGAIAIMNEYVYRFLKARIGDLARKV